jgi:hypothetical protein
MDRPVRNKKSTNLKGFYYPPRKKRIRKKETEVNHQISSEAANLQNPTTTTSQTMITSPDVQSQTHQNLDQTPLTPAAQEPTQPLENPAINQELNDMYTNPIIPSAYSGNLKKFILQKESISRHKQKINIFKRRNVFVSGPWSCVQADTIFYLDYAAQNNGNKYILAVVDVFSRRNWVRAQKTATANETAMNLQSIFNSMPYKPNKFSSDQGNEFNIKHPAIYELLVDKMGMIVFTLKAPLKASMVERFIRTLKGRIERHFTENNTKRWVDVLQQISDGINNTVNRSIGIEPSQVNFENRDEIFKKLYGGTPPIDCKFSVGDLVRLPLERNIFTKGYKAGWTKELYRVHRVFRTNDLCYYEIEDLTGDRLPKKYYNQGLNLVVRNEEHLSK